MPNVNRGTVIKKSVTHQANAYHKITPSMLYFLTFLLFVFYLYVIVVQGAYIMTFTYVHTVYLHLIHPPPLFFLIFPPLILRTVSTSFIFIHEYEIHPPYSSSSSSLLTSSYWYDLLFKKKRIKEIKNKCTNAK
jgi:hypothetical protein